MGITHFFVKKFKEMKKIVKIVAFRGNSGNSGGDGVLNYNHRGTGQGKKWPGTSGNGFLGFPLASLGTPDGKLFLHHKYYPQYMGVVLYAPCLTLHTRGHRVQHTCKG